MVAQGASRVSKGARCTVRRLGARAQEERTPKSLGTLRGSCSHSQTRLYLEKCPDLRHNNSLFRRPHPINCHCVSVWLLGHGGRIKDPGSPAQRRGRSWDGGRKLYTKFPPVCRFSRDATYMSHPFDFIDEYGSMRVEKRGQVESERARQRALLSGRRDV